MLLQNASGENIFRLPSTQFGTQIRDEDSEGKRSQIRETTLRDARSKV